MTWTELTREQQDDIILRSQNEVLDALAHEYNLLPQSLARKIRGLKQNGMYDYILNKLSKPQEKKGKIVSAPTEDPFLTNLFPLIRDSNNSIEDKDIRRIELNNKNVYLINPDKEWHGIFFTDLHCPYHDKKSVAALIRILNVLDHNILINGGDNLDLYGLSSYAKDSDMLFQYGFAGEVEAHNRIMEEIGQVTMAPKISLYGNHMERYDKWLGQISFMGTAKSNTQLSLNRVLSLKHYGWHDFADTIMFAKAEEIKYPKPILLLDHGTRVKSGAVKSAASQFNSFGAVSYIQGHVHRLGVGYQRTLHGQHCLAEGGTLRDITPEYLKYPDWANGLLHFVVDKDVVTITPILIENGVAYIGNTKV